MTGASLGIFERSNPALASVGNVVVVVVVVNGTVVDDAAGGVVDVDELIDGGTAVLVEREPSLSTNSADDVGVSAIEPGSVSAPPRLQPHTDSTSAAAAGRARNATSQG